MPTPLLTATATATDASPLLALLALAFIAWRLLAIWLFPYAPCRHCRGSGKHRSGKYWRPCRHCRGTSRRIRLGRRIWNWTRTTQRRGPS